jgi:uncharacterized coiled-coil protein SlyX
MKTLNVKVPSLSVLINIITIISFVVTVIIFVFNSGRKEERIVVLEKTVIEYKNKYETLKKEVNEQTKVVSDVNGKLDLLLEYFNLSGSR